ncbi:MAG TPA: hypothetical protein VFS20_18785 [Longimicrobium sp.]|nr:hypothetical protein [Longimicrobium sp.]
MQPPLPCRAVLAGVLLLLPAAPLQGQTAPDTTPQPQRAAPSRAQQLEELRVLAQRGGFGGFYDRVLAAGAGRFFTRADIDRLRPDQASDLFRNVPGFEVVQGSIRLRGQPARRRDSMSLMTSNRRSAASDSLGNAGRDGSGTVDPDNPDGGPPSMEGRTGRAAGCIPLIWVDGRRWDSDDGNLSSIPPNTIEGIEAYARPSMAPVQYRARNDHCGIVLIWLRRGS